MDIVSFEVAKLLKQKGFNELCRISYIPRICHNGEDISFDEECDLRDEGREDEIEVIDGGDTWTSYNQNSSNSDSQYAAPSLWGMMAFISDNYNLHITTKPYVYEDGIGYVYEIYRIERYKFSLVKSKTGFEKPDKACDAAIKYVYENLI